MRIAPGVTIARYVIEQLLGVGGMAEVWAVRHTLLGSRHALKVLSNTTPKLQQRLLKEASAQAALEHPYLLPVRDVLDLGDVWETASLEEIHTSLLPPHNLAPPRNRFFGRAAERDDLRSRLQDGQRLITLLGVGGIGKTRLAVEMAWEQRTHWSGGVWMCDLSEARSLDAVLAAVASALSVPLGTDPEGQLTNALSSRGPTLLILDNFEQIVDLGPQTVGRWLDMAPKARFLVTSREPLRISGEHYLALGVLSLDDAIAMFLARAQAVRPDLRDNEAVRADLSALVELLDRLPLAIELAAARRVQLEAHTGEIAVARKRLARATAIADELQALEDSPLRQALREARSVLDDAQPVQAEEDRQRQGRRAGTAEEQ